MILYIYDENTFEYIRKEEATIDPEMTRLVGKTCYAKYPNSTFIPAEHQVGKVAYFSIEKQQWEYISKDTTTANAIPVSAQEAIDKKNIKKYQGRIKEIELKYNEFLSTPVEYKGQVYLPRYIDTFTTLLNRPFPRVIWSADGKESKLVTKEELQEIIEYLDKLIEKAYQKKKEMIKKCVVEMNKLEARYK